MWIDERWKKLHFTCDGKIQQVSITMHRTKHSLSGILIIQHRERGSEWKDMECGCKILVNENLIGASRDDINSSKNVSGTHRNYFRTLCIGVPQKSLKNTFLMGVCGRKSRFSLIAEMSSKTKPQLRVL
jgi:hypothetical protein